MSIQSIPLRRQRSFVLLWSGQQASGFGTGLLQLAVLLHVYSSTHSVAATTVTFLAERAPFALLSPWAGSIADRVDRKTLLIRADLARAVLLLPLLLTTDLLVLIPVLAAQAAVGAFFQPAYGALLPSIVPTEQLGQANGLTQGSYAVLGLLCPPAGAAVYAAFGFSAIVLIDAGSFLLSVVTLVALRLASVTAAPSAPTTIRADLLVVRRTISTTPAIRLLFVTGIAFGFLESLIGPVFVPFLQGVLHAAPTSIGLAATAQSVGGLVGGVAVAVVARRMGAARMLAVGNIGLSACVVLLAVAPSYPVAVAALALLGVPGMLANVGSTTLLQTHVPEHLLGRVLGGFQAVFGVTTLVGALVPAFAAGLLGVRGLLLLGAAAGGVAAVLTIAGYRSLDDRRVSAPDRRTAVG